MNYKTIDMNSYKRKKHFMHFNSMAYPYLGMTVNVDISKLLKTVKSNGFSFFNAILYLITNSANEISEFKHRLNDTNDGIIEFETCFPSFTVALEDNTYCYCTLKCDKPFKEFNAYAEREKEKAKLDKILEDDEDVKSLYFISSVPWVSFTSVIQPTPYPADSNPRFLIGKFYEADKKILLPLSVQVNHSLIDGYQISLFFENLNKNIEKFVDNHK